ncbi:hypothetical protein FRC11_013258, partial [Ceratobasidium sp. 423]
IENVRFKVHKSKLIESETFADMFTVAQNSNKDGQVMEGFSTDHPIKLEGVAASDFESLLTLLYERHYTHQHPELDTSLVVPAFRLAHMWNFKELRQYLLPYLEKCLDDIDKIVYAREFDIKEWITPAYTRLYRRTEPLSTEEATKIGFESAMLIFRLREEKRTVPDQACCGRGLSMKLSCNHCGHSWRANINVSNETDQIIEDKIKAWEANGRVFKK